MSRKSARAATTRRQRPNPALDSPLSTASLPTNHRPWLNPPIPMSIARATLHRPSRRYQDSYIAAVREYIAEDLEPAWHPDILRERFDEYLLALRQAESDPLAGMVPPRNTG